MLLRINMEAGHGGASGRFDRLKEVALIYAFALDGGGEGLGAPQRSTGSRRCGAMTA